MLVYIKCSTVEKVIYEVFLFFFFFLLSQRPARIMTDEASKKTNTTKQKQKSTQHIVELTVSAVHASKMP